MINIKDIAALAEIVQKNGLTRLEVDGSHVTIERMPTAQPVQQIISVPKETAVPTEEMKDEKPGVYVKSPAVGVFYSAPSPESKPFVEIGDTVHPGDTLCIIEAMKLMNEITCEVEGKIAEICVGNGQVVEYDQPLFRIAQE